MSGRLMIVSPHPDDVALSCGGLVRQLRDVSLLIATCFSRSRYAPECRPPHGARQITRTRAKEERRYARLITCRLVLLGFADASVRRPEARRVDEEDSVRRKLEGRLRRVVRWSPDVILAPAGVGGHVDHVHCRDAVRSTLTAPVILYEDLPYAQWQGGPTATATAVRSVCPGATSLIVPLASDELEGKLSNLACYSSQVGAEWVDDVRSYAGSVAGGALPWGERYWARDERDMNRFQKMINQCAMPRESRSR